MMAGPALPDQADIIRVGEFSARQMDEWSEKSFAGETVYTPALIDGDTALEAASQSSASGLIRKIRIDIEAYPFLNWRWRIENRLDGTFDEKQKEGDDYAARIYVVVSGGLAVWNTRALNYVWAQNSQAGETWPNAFARDNAVMMALRSAKDPLSAWQTEKRNIREDFIRLFGKEVRYIDAVVLMSDTDNTGNKVTAYYGDIYFSRD
nr:DUF3047 domain-containing protein [Desulfobacula sp.]